MLRVHEVAESLRVRYGYSPHLKLRQVYLLHLFRSRSDQSGTDEALQPAGMRMQQRPIVDRQIDDDEPRSRQLLIELFAHVHIAGGDQLQREIVQARIMADDEQAYALCCVSPMAPISTSAVAL